MSALLETQFLLLISKKRQLFVSLAPGCDLGSKEELRIRVVNAKPTRSQRRIAHRVAIDTSMGARVILTDVSAFSTHAVRSISFCGNTKRGSAHVGNACRIDASGWN